MASYSVRLWSRKLRWFSRFSRSSCFAKAILQDIVNRKEGEVDRRRGGKTIIKSRQGCALPANLGQLKQDKLKKGCCEVICGIPITLRGYGITE